MLHTGILAVNGITSIQSNQGLKCKKEWIQGFKSEQTFIEFQQAISN